MSIRALIVDDEPYARERLRELCAMEPDVAVVGEASHGVEAIEQVEAARPNLLLLDVQMRGTNGFEVLDRLTGERPLVVFVSAYDQYALAAFGVEAVDYLLKPFDDARFAEALARAKATAEHRHDGGVAARLTQLLNDADRRRAGASRFLVRTAGRVLFLRSEDIDWVEAADYYVKLHVGGKVHMLRESMAALEARLDSSMFFRIHRSAIVNLERVRELQPYSKREHVLVLHDGTRLRLTRSRREQLAALLGQPL